MEIKLATWNISGGVSKEVEGDNYFDQEKSKKFNDKFLNEIIEIINKKKIDIICFQEIITTEKVKYLDTISQNSKLKYYKFLELSECNLVNNTNCGISILSKYPIESCDTYVFTNPKLSKTTKSGNTYYTYNKGCINCNILINSKSLNIINNHGFPFRRFNSTPEQNRNIFEEFNKFINIYDNRIVTGDFNIERPIDFISELSHFQQLNDDITTIDGMRFDKIFIEKSISCINFDVIKSQSDHYLLVCNLKI